MERPMMTKLPTWQHVDCPQPNGSGGRGCSRYAILSESAKVNAVWPDSRGTAIDFTLVCTGCGHQRAARAWLRAKPRGKRSRPARSVAEIMVED